MYEVLSTLKNKIFQNILIEKYKDMLENLNFEQGFWSKTAIGIYERGHDSIRLLKWLAYYDRSFCENMNYYDLMGSFSEYINEISQR